MLKEEGATATVKVETEGEPETPTTPDTEELEPVAAPGTAPAVPETTTPETPEAPAASAVTISSLAYVSPEATRLMNQFEGLERMMSSMRTSILKFLNNEQQKGGMAEGPQTFFLGFIKASHSFEVMAIHGQNILTGEVLVDNDGEPVATADNSAPPVSEEV